MVPDIAWGVSWVEGILLCLVLEPFCQFGSMARSSDKSCTGVLVEPHENPFEPRGGCRAFSWSQILHGVSVWLKEYSYAWFWSRFAGSCQWPVIVTRRVPGSWLNLMKSHSSLGVGIGVFHGPGYCIGCLLG
jgi:hypothetical protein